MKKNYDWIYLMAAVCLILGSFLGFIYLECVEENSEIERYSCMDDIQVTHTKKTVLAKINIIDTYTKENQKYYEITTDVTGERMFTYSEKEYDRLFGLGNNAFDCDVYSLSMDSTVLLKSGSQLGNLEYFEMKVTDYGEFELPEENTDIQIGSDTSQMFDFLKENNDEQEWEFVLPNINNSVFVRSYYGNRDVHGINSSVQEIRYSFLGEDDFSKEEIDVYLEEMHDVNLHVLEKYDEYIEN